MAKDPYRYFRVEARESLEQLGRAVLDLEKSPAPAHVQRLLRLAHTLKGAARVVKQREIAESAHAIEDALAPFRDAAGVPRERIDVVLEILDAIGARVAALEPAPEPAEGAGAARAQAEDPFRTVRADVAEMDSLLEGIAETHVHLGALRRSTGALERARRLAELLAGQLAAPPARSALHRGIGHGGERIRLIAEELQAVHGALAHGVASALGQTERELRQVLDAAQRLRLVPAGALFTSLERTARDAARALGKRVVFEGKGGDVRLDAHVLAAVQGALQHVVRNAVAHGIEVESARKAAGKPAEGRVLLDAARRGRRVAFICSDDGRGVDLEAVRRAVRGRGGAAAVARDLDSHDLLPLLLRGGISTSGTVTEVSGRGIGLDAVREVAERLGGDVSMRSETGRGTTVELVVPVSRASLETLVVEAAGAIATIPLDAVRGTLRLAAGELVAGANGESLVHEGKVVPFLPLARALGLRGLARGTGPLTAVVVAGAAGVAAVGVDRALGTANVMLRPLPELAPAAAVIAGASLDAEGAPRLVLDPDALVAEAGRAIAPQPPRETPRKPILVIDDSLTTRMLERSILESAGYEVDVASSGEEALEIARHRRYALFLVDLEMPGMDGFAFMERARADAALGAVPSIIVTSRTSAEDRRRSEQLGARAYIVKSEFDQGELLRRIGELTG